MLITDTFNPKRGDWLFTCRMEPVQFNEWHYDDLGHGDPDDFDTIDGSNHSAKHCGLKLISTAYAQWFISNKMWEWFDFFGKATVNPQAEWIRYAHDPESPITFWYRLTDNGVRYHYRRVRGVNKFMYITYGGAEPFSSDCVCFAYFPLVPHAFSISANRLQIYEGYIRWRCHTDGVVYEGY